MNNKKVIAVVGGAIAIVLAFSLLVRFVVLSQAGVPVGWIFYLGLPVGGIGVLVLVLRLGLLNFGERSSGIIHTWRLNSSGVQSPLLASPPPAAPVSQRLQELETLRASGTISDLEYSAKRQQIVSDM
jgi:hypothetical protein